MCRYCEYDPTTNDIEPLLYAESDYTEEQLSGIDTEPMCDLVELVTLNNDIQKPFMYICMSSAPNTCTNTPAILINYCPMCGRKLV